MEVEVEVLDVNDEEARTLLLSIDPLAAVAETQEALFHCKADNLIRVTPRFVPNSWKWTPLESQQALDFRLLQNLQLEFLTPRGNVMVPWR